MLAALNGMLDCLSCFANVVKKQSLVQMCTLAFSSSSAGPLFISRLSLPFSNTMEKQEVL